MASFIPVHIQKISKYHIVLDKHFLFSTKIYLYLVPGPCLVAFENKYEKKSLSQPGKDLDSKHTCIFKVGKNVTLKAK